MSIERFVRVCILYKLITRVPVKASHSSRHFGWWLFFQTPSCGLCLVNVLPRMINLANWTRLSKATIRFTYFSAPFRSQKPQPSCHLLKVAIIRWAEHLATSWQPQKVGAKRRRRPLEAKVSGFRPAADHHRCWALDWSLLANLIYFKLFVAGAKR